METFSHLSKVDLACGSNLEEALLQTECPFVMLHYPNRTSTLQEKLALFKKYGGQVGSILKSHSSKRVLIAHACSITGKAPKGEQFMATGLYSEIGNISDFEVSLILTFLGYEGVNQGVVKSVSFGRDSNIDLKTLGQGPGFVNPFIKNSRLDSFFLMRYLANDNSYYKLNNATVWVEFALAQDVGLLVPEPYLISLLRQYYALARMEQFHILITGGDEKVVFK